MRDRDRRTAGSASSFSVGAPAIFDTHVRGSLSMEPVCTVPATSMIHINRPKLDTLALGKASVLGQHLPVISLAACTGRPHDTGHGMIADNTNRSARCLGSLNALLPVPLPAGLNIAHLSCMLS